MRNKIYLIITTLLLLATTSFSQNVGINATGAAPASSAGLDVSFTNKGVLVPRVALTATNNASPVTSPTTSLLIYNTATAGSGSTAVSPGYYFWNGSSWVKFLDATSGDDWHIDGNSGTTAGTNFLGTTDNISLVVKTNNSERMRILNTGYVGINVIPTTLFDIDGGTGSTTQTIATITGNSLTSGKGLSITSSSITTGSLVDIEATNSTNNSAYTNTGLYVNNTGPYANAIQAIGAGTPNYSAIYATSSPVAAGTGFSISTSNHTINATMNNNYAYSFAVYGRIVSAPNPSGGVIGYYATNDYGILGYWNGAKTGVVGVGGVTSPSTLAGGSGGAFSSNNVGVYGKSDATSLSVGVYGTSDATDGAGVLGVVSGAQAIGVDAYNSNASGTGLISTGNGGTASYLINGTGISGTGLDGIVGWATDASGTGIIGVGNNGSTANTLIVGSGVAGSGTEVGVYGYANSATGAGVLGQNNNASGWAGDFQGNTKIGTSTSDLHNFWGTIQSGSTSDSHIIIPYTDTYGYVGTSSKRWWEMHAATFSNASERKLKRNIKPLNNLANEIIMNDIENLIPTFYKYKVETDNFEKGNEAKYRPATHIGFIVDQTPDYILDNSYKGIDIYALSTMSIIGVKYNRESIKKIQEKISDFGSVKMSGTEIWVNFSDEFSSKLSSNDIPVVTVTSNNPNVNLSVIEKTNKGFKAIASQPVTKLFFDWIAMAKTDKNNNDLTIKNIDNFKKKNHLLVPDSEKQKMENWINSENAKLDAVNARRKTNSKVTPRVNKEKKAVKQAIKK